MDRESILRKVEPMIEDELEPRGFEVVDVQYKSQSGHWVLQVFIDTPEGVDLETCQRASEIIGRLLDREDPIPHKYLLEVSSPGLDRVLKKDRDFHRFVGRSINLKVRRAIEGRRNFKGVLLGLEDGQVKVDVGEQVVAIPRENITQVRLIAQI